MPVSWDTEEPVPNNLETWSPYYLVTLQVHAGASYRTLALVIPEHDKFLPNPSPFWFSPLGPWGQTPGISREGTSRHLPGQMLHDAAHPLTFIPTVPAGLDLLPTGPRRGSQHIVDQGTFSAADGLS